MKVNPSVRKRYTIWRKNRRLVMLGLAGLYIDAPTNAAEVEVISRTTLRIFGITTYVDDDGVPTVGTTPPTPITTDGILLRADKWKN